MVGIVTKNGTTDFYRRILIFQGLCGVLILAAIFFSAKKIDLFSGTIMTIAGAWLAFISGLLLGLFLLTKSIISLRMIYEPILILSDEGIVLRTGMIGNRIIHLTWKDVRTIRISHEEYHGDSSDICCLVLSFYVGRQKPYDKYRIPFSEFKSTQDEVIAAIDEYRKTSIDAAATKHLAGKC